MSGAQRSVARGAARLRVRVAVGALAAAMGLGALGAGLGAEPTEAAFTGAAHAGGNLQAMEIPAPVAWADCEMDPGILGLIGPEVVLYWELPELDPPVTEPEDVEYAQQVGGILLPITSDLLSDFDTEPEGGNRYTTTFSGGLLGGVLGGSVTLGVRVQHPSGWVSPWLRAEASATLAGLFPECATSVDDEPLDPEP